MADRLLDRLLRPKVVFGTLAAIIVLASLLVPNDNADEASGTLSSLSYERSGVRGWYEGAQRLGWKVKRREERFHGTLSDSALYVVLAPEIEPTASEVGVLLAAVRRGAGLIVSAEKRSPLADSLHLFSDDFQYGGYPVVAGRMPTPRPPAEITMEDVAAMDSAADRASTDDSAAVADSASTDEDEYETTQEEVQSFDSAVSRSQRTRDSLADVVRRRSRVAPALAAYSYHVHAALSATRPLPRDTSTFLTVIAVSRLVPAVKPAAIGLPLGAGRVVVLADPGIVRNALLDEHDLVVLPQRFLEWAAPGAGAPVVFDEYHHGMGRHGSMSAAIGRALADTNVGRAGLQVMLAGLVLLIALGARPISPRPHMRLERRSPLEHVGALSRAYMQKGATRLAARRLVHGLRRRHGTVARSGDDEVWLRRIAERHPALRPSVERLVAATKLPVSPRDFTMLADDIDTIERTLRT
ncbi:MAG: hypothetical protein HOQ34_12540 [Gemmatimonadaceae bacterium]|nr:hypothetical protein [Gemmatimonadaceae bacterium]